MSNDEYQQQKYWLDYEIYTKSEKFKAFMEKCWHTFLITGEHPSIFINNDGDIEIKQVYKNDNTERI